MVKVVNQKRIDKGTFESSFQLLVMETLVNVAPTKAEECFLCLLVQKRKQPTRCFSTATLDSHWSLIKLVKKRVGGFFQVIARYITLSATSLDTLEQVTRLTNHCNKFHDTFNNKRGSIGSSCCSMLKTPPL